MGVSAGFQEDGKAPVGASPISVRGEKCYTYDGERDFSIPKEATHANIKELIAEYVQAAKNAIAIGAQLHCHNALPGRLYIPVTL